MAVEWPITVKDMNEFGGVCRQEVRISKSWKRLIDGEIGLSIKDGKEFVTALQRAVVNHEDAILTMLPLSLPLPERR